MTEDELVTLVEALRDVIDDPDLVDEDPELAELADCLPPPWVLTVWLEEKERLLAAAYGPTGQTPA